MVKKQTNNIETLAEKLGIKKENLEHGLKHDKEKTEKTILAAAKFMKVD